VSIFYSAEHVWIRIEGEIATLGITEHAAEELGDIVFIDLKEVGVEFGQGQAIGVIESVKTASEIYASASGEIIEVNPELINKPELVNDSPEERGWIYRIKLHDAGELTNLLDNDAYQSTIS
jgi:glycine cleavage system H protein